MNFYGTLFIALLVIALVLGIAVGLWLWVWPYRKKLEPGFTALHKFVNAAVHGFIHFLKNLPLYY